MYQNLFCYITKVCYNITIYYNITICMIMKKYIIILLGILLIATFFRLWGLETIPPGLYPDEAINGNQAITEPGKIFYPENQGREGFFINLISLSFSVFGISIWSLRLISAIIGILTVLGLYLLTKEVLRGRVSASSGRDPTSSVSVFPNYEIVALLSSFFLATSFWHINFSRIGFRAILVPFLLVFSFYFLFRGFRRKKISDFIIAGLIFGLGFHTYIAFRLAVLLLGIVLILWWFIYPVREMKEKPKITNDGKKNKTYQNIKSLIFSNGVYRKQNLQKQFLLFTFSFLLFIFLAALLIGVYFLQNPGDFIGRASGVSIFAQQNIIKSFGESLISHLAMFNFLGDNNWRHNISDSPVLFWPVGILFLLGLFYSLYYCTKSISLRNKKPLEFLAFSFLIFWFFIMLLPGILTYEGIPHSLRCIGAIPPVFIFAGIGGEFLFRKIKSLVKIQKKNLFSILIFFSSVLLIISFIFAQHYRYFVLWAKNLHVEGAFCKSYVEVGNCLNSLPLNTQKYVIVNQAGILVDGIPMPAQTPMFIENTKIYSIKTLIRIPSTIYLLPENLDKIKIQKEETVIVLMAYDGRLSDEIQNMFPQGEIQEKNGVWRYEINY